MLARLASLDDVARAGLLVAAAAALTNGLDATVGLPRLLPSPAGPAPSPGSSVFAAAFAIAALRRAVLWFEGVPHARRADRIAWAHDGAAALAGCAAAVLGVSDPAAFGLVVAVAHLLTTPFAAAALARAAAEPADETPGRQQAATWSARPLTALLLLLGTTLWLTPVSAAYDAAGRALLPDDPATPAFLAPLPQLAFHLAVLSGLAVWGLLAVGLAVPSRRLTRAGVRTLAFYYSALLAIGLAALVSPSQSGAAPVGYGALTLAALGPCVVVAFALGAGLGAYPAWRNLSEPLPEPTPPPD